MESVRIEQQTSAKLLGRWIVRGVALALIGGLLLAEGLLIRRGPQGVPAVEPPTPVTLSANKAEPVIAPFVQIEPSVLPPDTTVDTEAQPPVTKTDSQTIDPPETILSAATNIFPVLEGFGFQPEDWLVVRDVPLGEDPENPALGGELAVFALEPLAAPCCPTPTSDKAVDAALSLPGVLAAKVNETGTLLVRYDPVQIESDTIASTVNRASFLVQTVEANE